jgi:hypothetical protein
MHKFCASEGAAAREALFIDLIRAISKCWVPGLHGIAAVVSTAALSRFNQERRRNIDAVSFALFNCLHMKDPNLRQSLIELGGATQITTAVWTYEALCAQDDERDGRWTIKLECCAGGQEAQAKTLTQQGLKGG